MTVWTPVEMAVISYTLGVIERYTIYRLVLLARVTGGMQLSVARRMNSRLQLQNPPTRIHFQSPKGDFAAVARGFNRRAMGS